jgi:hypothetical protein
MLASHAEPHRLEYGASRDLSRNRSRARTPIEDDPKLSTGSLAAAHQL